MKTREEIEKEVEEEYPSGKNPYVLGSREYEIWEHRRDELCQIDNDHWERIEWNTEE